MPWPADLCIEFHMVATSSVLPWPTLRTAATKFTQFAAAVSAASSCQLSGKSAIARAKIK